MYNNLKDNCLIIYMKTYLMELLFLHQFICMDIYQKLIYKFYPDVEEVYLYLTCVYISMNTNIYIIYNISPGACHQYLRGAMSYYCIASRSII